MPASEPGDSSQTTAQLENIILTTDQSGAHIEQDISTPRQRSRQHRAWIYAHTGNIYYRPSDYVQKHPCTGALPAPLIGPRRHRPHAIRVVTYPPGYVPRDLRQLPEIRRSRHDVKIRYRDRFGKAPSRSPPVTEAHPSCDYDDNSDRPSIGKVLASLAGLASSSSNVPTASQSARELISAGSLAESAAQDLLQTCLEATAHQQLSQAQHLLPYRQQDLARSTTEMAGRLSSPPSSFQPRAGLMSARAAKSAVTTLVTEVPKPVATGSGVSCSILLAEPNVFLFGFDHDGTAHREGNGGTALLRGKLQMNVSKNIKVKAVQLKLIGRARTEWPEGIPPLKQELCEEQGLRTQVLTFFNALNNGWETEYGNQCTWKLKTGSANSSSTNLAATNTGRPGQIAYAASSSSSSQQSNLTAKDLKRLSLQHAQSRSFSKGDTTGTAPAQAKGYKVFLPGTYDYTFELPIDHHQLETIKLQYGSVRWELHAIVERAGAFKPKLHGIKEVPVIRVPDQMSLEMSEPISISRQWEDQLHYDIIISGKSFPIGTKIPVAFKLTPLAKVQVHKLKVFVTESIEYWTNDKRVTRKDPGRKILLLEKAAGKPLDPMWASSDLRVVRGGELSSEQREEARNVASRRRSAEAAMRNVSAEPLPAPSENILGDLDLGLESYWGSTEIEANVQIPTCEMMAKNKDLRLNPDCSWKNVNVFHWIKIVMRISRLDPDDPSGTKRRHFEISIDSPFTVLNCKATQANMVLPAYAGPKCQPSPYQASCGCPDATSILMDKSPESSSSALVGLDGSTDSLPAPPQAAHLSSLSAANPATASPTTLTGFTDNFGLQAGPRPIHLLRAPSYNPPAFNEDVAPPSATFEVVNTDPHATDAPLPTPPPQYDVVIGTPSVDGLADYFSRLADYGYDESEDDSAYDSDDSPLRILDRSGRVNVAHPHTPGGRMTSRSMEIPRPPITLNMQGLITRANAPAATPAATTTSPAQ